MVKVLVTGATGFIGKRLIYKLLDAKHEVYALTRVKGRGWKMEGHPNFHLIFGDLREGSNKDLFPKDIEAAFYLVHSMAKIRTELVETEVEVARNFLKAIEATQCRQIIYLSGIIEKQETLSPHLRSRLEVERLLKTSSIPTTVLRASIIIGSGSASFEIIRDLVEKLPFMIAPRWVHSFCQPIAIRDVLFYLVSVLDCRSCFNQTFDIGGPEAMTFRDVLLRYAKLRHLKRIIWDVPVLTPKLSSYWLVLITSVPYPICSHLVESMKQNTRKLNRLIDTIIPHQCISYEEAIQIAFEKIAQNEVLSSWMDAWDLKKIHVDLKQFIEVPQEGCFKKQQIASILVPIEQVKKRIWSIGGSKGWYSMSWAWQLRGLIDRILGGRGVNLQRKNPAQLLVGDAVDFWRVILADEEKMHLILYAEMKLPGEAWLEFQVERDTMQLIQTATFRPLGFWGRVYWYAMMPFHWIIFRSMAKKLTH